MAFGFSAEDQERKEAREKRIKEALTGMAAFFNGEDDCPGISVEGLADYEPVDITLNAGIVRAVLKAADDIR